MISVGVVSATGGKKLASEDIDNLTDVHLKAREITLLWVEPCR